MEAEYDLYTIDETKALDKKYNNFYSCFFQRTNICTVVHWGGRSLSETLIGFVSFSFMASAVYVFNDMRDVEKDRKHPIKKNRPIASGKVTKRAALLLLAVCVGISSGLNLVIQQYIGLGILLFYLIINILYSIGLKNLPIVDIVILSFGYVLRIIYGAMLVGVEVSGWLYLTVFAGSFYMVLGKRRNEMKSTRPGETRSSLQLYNYDFLDKNMYVCLALVEVFYALWALEQENTLMVWSAFGIMVILMRYSLDVEGISNGDPIEVVMADKVILILGILFVIYITVAMYIL